MKSFFFTVIILLTVFDTFGQEADSTQNYFNNYDRFFKSREDEREHNINREIENEKKWFNNHKIYVDAAPDTLYLDNDKYYLFRRTPLSLRIGYSDIFSIKEVDLATYTSFPPTNNNGKKGYVLTWIIINDSLFIKKITPDYNLLYDEVGGLVLDENGKTMPNLTLPEDTIIARFEKFTDCKFNNDKLLFIDWITGDFGVITMYSNDFRKRSRNPAYSEAINNGCLVIFDNGLFVEMREDKRENKY